MQDSKPNPSQGDPKGQTKSKSSDILIPRLRMAGEGLIPQEIWNKYLVPKSRLLAFLEIPDPDQWPPEMQGLKTWIEENIPPEYWADPSEFE